MTLAIIISLVFMIGFLYINLDLISFFQSSKFKRIHKDECKKSKLFNKRMVGGL